MNIKDILKRFELSTIPKYQVHIDKIDSLKTTDFVKAMINSIIRKYGSENVIREIIADNSNSKISTHLTHIIEVGGLKVISDNNLLLDIDINEDFAEFKNMIVSVVMLMNCSIAQELNNLNLFNEESYNYYNIDAMMIISSRLANHTLSGIKNKNGLEYYSNNLIFDNLINELT
jgi:hypothetical protein